MPWVPFQTLVRYFIRLRNRLWYESLGWSWEYDHLPKSRIFETHRRRLKKAKNYFGRKTLKKRKIILYHVMLIGTKQTILGKENYLFA